MGVCSCSQVNLGAKTSLRVRRKEVRRQLPLITQPYSYNHSLSPSGQALEVPVSYRSSEVLAEVQLGVAAWYLWNTPGPYCIVQKARAAPVRSGSFPVPQSTLPKRLLLEPVKHKLRCMQSNSLGATLKEKKSLFLWYLTSFIHFLNVFCPVPEEAEQ